ncbi:MAG: hypothetical protein INH41_30355 [Myxococcaceae bacterium]|nr:hypothetical protein [Myxococcaceae bacterium]MCA3016707.1 hypothetical protein [Myxococcaceae bacterium]
MSRLRPGRAHHPLAPLFRRRTAHLLRALQPTERAVIRVLPVLLAARFRRPGFDKEPPGLERMPMRRRWGRACELLDFPPPLAFCSTRPLVESAWLEAEGERWAIIVRAGGERSQEEHRRLDERVQMIGMLLERQAPRLTIVVHEAGALPAREAFFAGLVAGDVVDLDDEAPPDVPSLVRAAPTAWSRTLVLAVSDQGPTGRLLPGIALAAPERFAAAAAADPELLDRALRLEREPTLLELQQASRAVRQHALRRWKRSDRAQRALLSADVRRWALGASIVPALRPRLEALLDRHVACELQRGGRWCLDVDGATLIEAATLDGLRAKAVSESPALAPAQPEWRRAKKVLQQRTGRSLLVVEPGFLQHLVLRTTRSGRLRARRLKADRLVRLAVALRSSGQSFELVGRPGADPQLVSRLAQLAVTEMTAGATFAVQRDKRVMLTVGERMRERPLLAALSAPRRLSLLPERAEWFAALRPPRSIAGRPTVQATVHEGFDGEALALFVDDTGLLFAEAFPRPNLEWWVADTRLLLEQVGASFSLSVGPELSSFTRRMPEERVEPVALIVTATPAGLVVDFGEERFGARQALGWRALAETIFSHWPPGIRGRIRVVAVHLEDGQETSGSPLGVLSLRSRALRRLWCHLGSLARRLEAA